MALAAGTVAVAALAGAGAAAAGLVALGRERLRRRYAAVPAELAHRPLESLEYVVFDTETTGFDPRRDRIVSIGAVRVRGDAPHPEQHFGSLVDPGIPVPMESTAVHGLDDVTLAGQPPIEAVLPRFAAFVEGAVLVAHNAAFDLGFLARPERRTGVRLPRPVLDTLLLSAVAFPEAERHDLESIANRLDVPILGRHTAQGDAAATAAIFVRLLPRLRACGLATVGAVQAAAHRTRYARRVY